MRLATFCGPEGRRIGVLVPDGSAIVDLSETTTATDMASFVALGRTGLTAAREALEGPSPRYGIDGIRLLAPIVPPRNIFCIGKNYVAHAREFGGSGFDASAGSGEDVPEYPIVFTKAPSSVIGPGEAIPSMLDPTRSTDYEGELAVVIGDGGRGIPRRSAVEHVYGYTIVNDVTARDIQRDHKQWFLGKSIDGFCPMGPYLVTADHLDDIREATLTTSVNGEERQKAKIEQLIFDIPVLIEILSRGITLQAGDVIATGTPAGVGIGFDPPKYLRPGDIVSVAIDGLGRLQNPVA